MDTGTDIPRPPQRKLRVAICTDGLFPLSTGGMQRHSRLLVEHLAHSDALDLTIIHPHPPGQFHEPSHVREESIPPVDTDRLYLRELWRSSRHTASVLHRLQPDLIFSQGFSVWSGIRHFQARLIFHPHGLEMFQGLTGKEKAMGLPFRWLVGHLARKACATVSLGGKLTGILQAQGAREVVVLPNAVEIPAGFQRCPPGNGTVRFLFVGRFAFNKGIDLLMAVARRFANEGIPASFELVGGGPLLEHYRSTGLPPNVELLGRVDDDQLFSLYAERDCLVLPTRFEGMPTVVLEAMARGCPVVVSDVGATADLVRDGHSGFLLPPGDAKALYEGLLRFINLSGEARHAMGLAGQALAGSRFAWPRVAAEYVALFQRLALEQEAPSIWSGIEGRPVDGPQRPPNAAS